MLSCSIWFSAPSLWMGGGLESRCVGRVYGADGAVRQIGNFQTLILLKTIFRILKTVTFFWPYQTHGATVEVLTCRATKATRTAQKNFFEIVTGFCGNGRRTPNEFHVRRLIYI